MVATLLVCGFRKMGMDAMKQRRRCVSLANVPRHITDIANQSRGPTQECLGAEVLTLEQRTPLGPLKVPENGPLWEVPAVETCTNEPVKWP